MINSLGLLEVDGMVAAVDAADAMLKAANVRLLSHQVLDPGRLTLVVEGDLAACRAALDAGCAAAARTGRVISRKEIGRPDDDTQWLIGGFTRQPKKPEPKKSEPKPEVTSDVKTEKTQETPVSSESSDELLALLTSVRQGMTAGEVAAHFGWSLDKARIALEQLFSAGALRKRSSRYRLKN
ncbi:ethanolamine utilization microcompartment protein EutK [Citrobacter freundii]|uniref:ethanolamine utilization microcompartment protein EutK n=1 Tax=Citrobacter sp. TBCS-14 TaxID=2576409 RepID=UPI001135D599|nr:MULTISPECIES: ethanolamine utilization microcompartment protein EutK [Citrobacter]TKV23922.1 ethanolamine utilization microcompartment protein EutK [Citrobacter sp. TBCS-14]WFW14479.1 ethanolamine utilization microcompartment protein EutK [Citrobacter freundii]